MIFTTVISNVENTLANFIEDTETEEVVAFKAYLRLAIANYAAAGSSPAPPKIPTHSRPAKGNATGSAKEKSVLKKVAIAIPQIVVPKVAEKLWATVTRNGQKKARITQSTQSNKLQAIPVSKTKQSVSNKNKSPTLATADIRLFIRLPQDNKWRKLSPAGVREVIVRKLVIPPTLFGKLKPVNSGFAINLNSTVARETILNPGKGFSFSGAKLKPATNWVSVIVPTVPSKIRKEQGEIEVSSSMLTDKIERVCSLYPANLKLYGRNKAEAPHRAWMAFFTIAPSTKFRVFDESGIVRSFKKQQLIELKRLKDKELHYYMSFRVPESPEFTISSTVSTPSSLEFFPAAEGINVIFELEKVQFKIPSIMMSDEQQSSAGPVMSLSMEDLNKISNLRNAINEAPPEAQNYLNDLMLGKRPSTPIPEGKPVVDPTISNQNVSLPSNGPMRLDAKLEKWDGKSVRGYWIDCGEKETYNWKEMLEVCYEEFFDRVEAQKAERKLLAMRQVESQIFRKFLQDGELQPEYARERDWPDSIKINNLRNALSNKVRYKYAVLNLPSNNFKEWTNIITRVAAMMEDDEYFIRKGEA
ncbi:putative eka-like protein [Erysiphe necator]|uniref:Putative eka-like protein n=1 Tax=Uncinula necator TaxID=52586 RepID=A0A0B1P3T9_UNCNE|nr:putative eka-like protein [Erysiphe necator]